MDETFDKRNKQVSAEESGNYHATEYITCLKAHNDHDVGGWMPGIHQVRLDDCFIVD